MPAGRPLKYNNCLDLDMDCQLYFDACAEDGKHPTVSGLAVALDIDRRSITNYQDRPEFFPTIKRAKSLIEDHLEQCLFNNSVTGVIFNLKNNFEWKDKQEQEISGPGGGPIEVKETKFTLIKPEDES